MADGIHNDIYGEKFLMSDEFNDEHSGRGGSYVIDADGKRQLKERTDTTIPADQPTNAVKPKKGASDAQSN